MLIKLLFCDGRDFEHTLKLRRLTAFGLLAVGLVGIACYFLLVPGGSLPDFAQGFYLGAASGICLGAALLLVRTQILLHNPEKRKQARIRETDERQRSIVNRAFQASGAVTFFTSAAALFVVLPLSMAAFCALLGGMAVYALTFLAAMLILERRM